MKKVTVAFLMGFIFSSFCTIGNLCAQQITFPHTYWYTPAASSPAVAAFGYVSKIKPTPEEMAAEKRRIRLIIDNGIRQEYGSWENYEKSVKEAGREIARHAERERSSWARRLMPSSLIEKTVPLVLGGALRYVMAHPEAQSKPFGNLGQTGIVLLDAGGSASKIPIGIDQPVISLSFSPGGRWVAVLSDMSTEDKAGHIHTAGRISVVDLTAKKIIKEWVLANVTDEIRFTPDGRYLTLLVQNPEQWSEKAIRFIDTRTWRFNDKVLRFTSRNSSGNAFGKEYRRPHYLFSGDGRVIAVVMKDGSIQLHDSSTLKPLFKVTGGGGAFAFAHNHPWLFDDNGRLWDYRLKKMLWQVNEKFKPYKCVSFLPDDSRIIVTALFGMFRSIDPVSGRILASSKNARTFGGIFYVSQDGHFVVAFMSAPNNRFANYGGYIKRRAVELKILDPKNIRMLRSINFENSTVLDAAIVGKKLFVSDFDSIHVYNLPR